MALALDGSNSNVATFNGTTTLTLTTTNANDIIVGVITCNALGTSVTGGGLTFTQRAQARVNAQNWYSTTFAAVSPSIQSGTTFTFNWSNGNTLAGVWIFGVSGADTSTIWDTNASLPALGQFNGTTDSETYSTTFANNFLISVYSNGVASPGPPTGTPSGWANIGTGTFCQVAYNIVSSPVSGGSLTWNSSSGGAVVVDAILAAGQIGGTLMGQQCM